MDSAAFLARVEEFHKAGRRLALINVTTLMAATPEEEGAFEIAWAFAAPAPEGAADRAGAADVEYIRERIAPEEQVPSISEYFGAAFLYENEMRELFGIDVTGIVVDFKGQLYKTATRVPFSHRAVKARLDAMGGSAPAPKAHA